MIATWPDIRCDTKSSQHYKISIFRYHDPIAKSLSCVARKLVQRAYVEKQSLWLACSFQHNDCHLAWHSVWHKIEPTLQDFNFSLSWSHCKIFIMCGTQAGTKGICRKAKLVACMLFPTQWLPLGLTFGVTQNRANITRFQFFVIMIPLQNLYHVWHASWYKGHM